MADEPTAASIERLLASSSNLYSLHHASDLATAVRAALVRRFDICVIDEALVGSPDRDLAPFTDRNGLALPLLLLSSTKEPLTGGLGAERIPKSELTPYLLEKEILWVLERRRFIDERAQAEERMRIVAASAPVVLFTVDREGIFTMAEGKGLRSLGYNPGEAVGRSVFEIYASEESIVRNIRRALEGESFEDQVRVGDLVYECHYAPILEEGGIAGVIGIATDMTDRLRDAEERRRSEERFRAIWESAVDTILLIDPDGTIVAANPAAFQLSGYAAEEMVGSLLTQFFPERLRERAARRYAALFAADSLPPTYEFPVYRRSGERRIVEARINFIENDGKRGSMVAALRDITERKRIEKSLQESEENFRLLIENALDIITIIELDGTIRFQSPSLERVVGFKPEELVGQNAFSYIHPEDLPGVMEIFLDAISTPGKSAGAEFRFLNSEGGWIYLESIGTNLIEHPGIRGVVLNSRDVTSRKLAEEALKEAHDKLELRVQERTAEIVQMMARLEQAHAMQKRFIADASHDLRTPLTVIAIEADLLLETGGYDEATRESLERIKAEVEQLAHLANDLLLLASLDASQPRNIRNDVRLDELLLECVTQLTSLARERSLVWDINVDDGIIYACDTRAMHSALMNVLENAIKYSREHGKIDVQLREDEDRVAISVTDNGIGIAQEELDRVFDRFYRSDRTRSTQGTGLGLAIVKAVIEAHDGTVKLESELGSWTRMTISLPKK